MAATRLKAAGGMTKTEIRNPTEAPIFQFPNNSTTRGHSFGLQYSGFVIPQVTE
jgi:hypothetical protein